MREGRESGRRIEQWPVQSAEYKAEVFVTQAQEEQ